MKKILNNKFIFYLLLVIIMIISLFNMYNAKFISNLYSYNLPKQILWYLIGLFLLITTKFFNIKIIFKYAHAIYIISLLLLLYVLLFGKVINGARAWITLKGLSFQPSELAKLSLTIYLSKLAYYYKKTNLRNELIYIFKMVIITLIPSILVFLEPDTGAIIYFICILFTILLLSDIHKIWYVLGVLFGLLCILTFILLYLFNKDLLIDLIGTSFFYRVERLITFKTMSSYQLENALIAMGSATMWGTGLGKVAIYIPEAPTDFIFAFTISNFGYMTGFIVLLCYLDLDLFLIHKLVNMKNSVLKYFVASFTSIFILGQIINIGMNLGLLPIIGIPLPFLSYGGSTLIIYFLYLSIIFNSKPLVN